MANANNTDESQEPTKIRIDAINESYVQIDNSDLANRIKLVINQTQTENKSQSNNSK